MNKQTLLPAIERGDVAVTTIDDKVRRILRTEFEFGFCGREQTDLSIPLYSQSGRELALEEACSGMVLLKNENGILPLDKHKIKSIAVLGPDAYPAVIGGGGSSLSMPFRSVSYLVGIGDYLDTRFAIAVGGGRGLKGEYFNNDSLEGSPALVRTDEKVNFRRGEGSYVDNGPVDHFSVRWTGYFRARGDRRLQVLCFRR